MKKQVIICDLTKEPGAVELRMNTGQRESDGVELSAIYKTMDLDPELVIHRLNQWFSDYSEERQELWNFLTRKL